MKKLFSILLLAVGANAAVPDYKNFDIDDFTMGAVGSQSNIMVSDKFPLTNHIVWGTNATKGTITNRSATGVEILGTASVTGRLTNSVLSPNSVVFTDGTTPPALTTSGSLPTLPNSWLPSLGYEVWYEPFGAGDNAAGTLGALGWTGSSGGAGGGSINWSNSVGHWGIQTISTSGSANSIHSMALGDSPNAKPWIPSLSAVAGWTNVFVWRLRQTNAVRCFFGLIGNANYTQAILENAMGFYLVTTNSASIMGMVSTASVGTTTNIQNVVVDTWYTNVMWSHSAGTVCFSINGGTPATLTTPNFQLTPSMGLVKSTTTAAVTLEMDIWWLLWARN